jgi:hypothetical protein
VALAETSGIDGAKWYLVKAETGATGWIKEPDKDEAKKLDSQFKTFSVELSLPKSRDPFFIAVGFALWHRITVPVESNGSLVIIRVTFNSSLTANLLLIPGQRAQ